MSDAAPPDAQEITAKAVPAVQDGDSVAQATFASSSPAPVSAGPQIPAAVDASGSPASRDDPH